MPELREDWSRGLCVAAHPDDLEYGTSAAVARWTSQGKTISYLLVTSGEAGIDSVHPQEAKPIRQEEERRGAREVGVDDVVFLDHPDGVVEYGPALRRDITEVIRQERPEVVFSGTFTERMIGGVTNQADHRAVGLATLDASRDAGNRWVFPELAERGAQPWSGVRYVCLSGAPEPRCGVDVTASVDAAVASLQAHAAYLAALGGQTVDAGMILRRILGAGGARMGVEAAVLFDVYSLDPWGPPPWTEE
jgi:LmbE family N-acetylglucosaminyl deacetylase